MGRKRFSAEEIVNKLRQADVELSRGSTVARSYMTYDHFVPAGVGQVGIPPRI